MIVETTQVDVDHGGNNYCCNYMFQSHSIHNLARDNVKN